MFCQTINESIQTSAWWGFHVPLCVVRHGGVDGHHGAGRIQQGQISVPAQHRNTQTAFLGIITFLSAAFVVKTVKL